MIALLFSVLFFISSGNAENQLDSYEYTEVTTTAPSSEPTVERWYIRRKDSICVPFQFNGYHKNLNIFHSREECLQHFQFPPEEQLAKCEEDNPILEDTTAPPPCYGIEKMRYHYVKGEDNKIGKCEPFTWKGCGGNANNFLTLEQCRNACTKNQKEIPNKFDCHLPFKFDETDINLENKVVADMKNSMCVNAAIGKNTVRGVFHNITHCRETCFPEAGLRNYKCTGLPRQGSCIGKPVVKYFFDRLRSLCLPFYAKDCKNEDLINSFDTLTDCMGTCPANNHFANANQGLPEGELMCDQSLDLGIGEMKIYQWYYNPIAKLCQAFYFKGIGGNENRFESKEYCTAACSDTPVIFSESFNEPEMVENEIDENMIEKNEIEVKGRNEEDDEDDEDKVQSNLISEE